MPIFEEKLICPLAIRFTQEHIRPVFQDGVHEIDATIRAIESRPGKGDYDVILEAPFPKIEVVRWYQQGELRDRDDKHWFTLDNRRLYCLQRCAAALWPRRCAAVVECLYNATDGIRRKDNSSSAGKTVNIGHSMKQLTGSWDWRQAVPADRMEGPAAERAEALIVKDETRPSVKDLLDAPAPPSMLDLFFQAQEAPQAVPHAITSSQPVVAATVQVTSRSKPLRATGGGVTAAVTKPTTSEATCSTGDPSTPRSAGSSDIIDSADSFPALSAGLSGMWHGEKGETFELRPRPDTASWTCVRTDACIGGGSRRFTLWYDKETDAVWWGSSWSLYLKASHARQGKPTQVSWFSDREDGRRKERFVWKRVPVTAPTETGDAQARKAQSKAKEKAPAPATNPRRRRAKAAPVGGAGSYDS